MSVEREGSPMNRRSSAKLLIKISIFSYLRITGRRLFSIYTDAALRILGVL